jgi:hypothetical protein
MSGTNEIIENLRRYKSKYYLNSLIKGSLFFLALGISYFLLINSLEFTFKLSTIGRGLLFFSFLLVIGYVGYIWLIDPLIKLFFNSRQLSDEAAAVEIGKYFPDISDKLLNTIQLSSSDYSQGSLIAASIEQRTQELSKISFPKAIDLNLNLKYLKYVAIPVIVLIGIVAVLPQMITESTGRIIKFQTKFEAEAPFQMILQNESLTAFKNEDFTLDLAIEGQALPEQVFMVIKGRKIKLEKSKADIFTYTFRKIQDDTKIYFEASGFSSNEYKIEVRNRPNLRSYNVRLDFPSHISRKSEVLNNTSSLEIPEGTKVTWQFGTLYTSDLGIKMNQDGKVIKSEKVDNQLFELQRQFFEDESFDIQLENEYAKNKENISFSVQVIKDEFPQIVLEPFQDTTLYSYIILGGNIEDDYGINNLNLYYQKSTEEKFTAQPIPFAKNQNQQSFFYNWKLDSMMLKEGESINYYVQVWDNDGINGNKSARTGTFSFKVPTKRDIKEKLEKVSQSAESQIDDALSKAEELQKELDEIEKRLKSKKNLDWQDEKLAEELMKKREDLEEEIKKLQEKNKDYFDKQERFQEPSKNIKAKVDQLKKLMDELLDDETKKLYEDLKKLLEEKGSTDNIREMIDKIKNKEENVEKELERALELFKRMKFDFKLEEVIKDLDETAKAQEELAEESKDKNSSSEEIKQKQEELNKDFEKTREEIEKLKELNEELESPSQLEDTQAEEEEIEKDQKDAQENLEQNKKQKASENQKGAAKKMESLKDQMQSMQQSMEMEMMEENMDDLRDILDNLIKLSFDQENLMNDFKNVNQSDPRFVTLSQNQLQLKDNAKIIEDSLRSLASRVFQIASFVTREVDEMNDNMKASLDALKERNKNLAVSKQQFTMTSMNNLALLLDDVMQQMQQAMADAKGTGKGNKKGKKQEMPSLSDLQKQLNSKIDELKKGGKSGRELSEQLSKLAAEQEMLRQQLQEMGQKMEKDGGEGPGGNLQELMKKMEETETDLVNKRLTEQMKQRQEDILTRLLKAEDAMRERELDDKREGESAKKTVRDIPSSFEEYIKAKEKEIELLKTIPMQLNPYYKKEVNEYFKRIGQQ